MTIEEPTTKNDLGVEHHKQNIQAYAHDFGVSEEQAETELRVTKNDLGVDAVSREAVLDLIADYDLSMGQVVRGIHALSSITPQEPKTGHWIVDVHRIRAFGNKNETHDYSVHCDKCNYGWDYTTDKEGSLVSNYCPKCGAKMESEVDNGNDD